MLFSSNDAQFMARALRLAEKGRFTTSPNPNVGCVIVDESGHLLSEGFHLKAGEAHAEINALNGVSGTAANTTVYVTLEPCSHYGRTPPCCDALIRAGVGRVVIATEDPHPKVSGRGIKKLRDAGIQVDVGLFEAEAKRLNAGFIKRHTQGLPRVTLKLAASLDGKTALSNGVSQWITGPLARQDVQTHRAKSCAIVSGSGTVLADDPSLNVRSADFNASTYAEYPSLDNGSIDVRQPLRVIFDGRGQLHPALKIFANIDNASGYETSSGTLDFSHSNTLVINLVENQALTDAGIQQWQAPRKDEKINLTASLEYLASLQINDLWLEAGSRLAGAFIQEQLVDEFILYLAPKILGDKSFSLLNLPEFSDMTQVPELEITDTRMVGQDLKLTTRFKY